MIIRKTPDKKDYATLAEYEKAHSDQRAEDRRHRYAVKPAPVADKPTEPPASS